VNPQGPRGVAHLDAGQQHPVQGDEHRYLDHDRETAPHGVDLFLAVDLHHLLLHLLRVFLQALAHLGDARIDGLHLGHAAVGLGIEPVERDLEQQHQAHDRPAPVAQEAVDLVEQPVQRLGQDRQPAVVLDQFQSWGQGFELLFFLGAGKEFRLDRLGRTW
jgi:hypothetical protein